MVSGEQGRHSTRDVLGGVLLTGLLHAACWIASMPLPGGVGMDLRTLALPLLGLSQWVYLLPAILICRRRGRPGIAQGLLLGGALTFLLNVACFGLLWGFAR